MPEEGAVATKTRPCIALYKAMGNPGFCIAACLNLQSGNNLLYKFYSLYYTAQPSKANKTFSNRINQIKSNKPK